MVYASCVVEGKAVRHIFSMGSAGVEMLGLCVVRVLEMRLCVENSYVVLLVYEGV